MTGHARAPQVASEAIECWRTTMIDALRSGGMSGPKARRSLAGLEDDLRWIAARLHDDHGSPHLENFSDPTDEFIFIVLSRKTAERAYTRAFKSLKQSGSWQQVLDLGERRIEAAIYGCGLESKKAHAIVAGLQTIVDRFGAADLSRADNLADDDLFAFLSALPEVGPKSSRCVMLYSFGRAAFPVDAHVGRVLARVGCMRVIGLELLPMGHKERQRILERPIPPDLRFGLHVNLVAHGRSICKATSPACHECVLALRCQSFSAFTTR